MTEFYRKLEDLDNVNFKKLLELTFQEEDFIQFLLNVRLIDPNPLCINCLGEMRQDFRKKMNICRNTQCRNLHGSSYSLFKNSIFEDCRVKIIDSN